MKIGLYANPQKRDVLGIAKKVAATIQEKNGALFAIDDIGASLELPVASIETLDAIICIGGDGTILGLFKNHPGCEAPILGINAGHLGFLTEVPLDELDSALETFMNGDYVIQERLMMEGSFGLLSFFAINDIVIHRSSIPTLVDLSIKVDGNPLNTFCADGMILATPSGSTAYSLSAGGPILSTELEALVLTPICPHTISNRPIVLMPKKSIEIMYLGEEEGVDITFDGHFLDQFLPGERLVVSPSKKRFKMIQIKAHNYFQTLRSKLGWSGQLRYKNLPLTHGS